MFKRVAEDSETIFSNSVFLCGLNSTHVGLSSRCQRAAPTTNRTKQPMQNKIESIIATLPTYHQRMAAEAILDLLVEGAISEREAKRQLAVNGINI